MTAEEWNETYEPGQPVKLTEDDGTITHTKTRTEAWSIDGGDPEIDGGAFIHVEGRVFCCFLTRIEPIT